ncbi:MAG TPA: WXG100 family type VII secretion target [Acidimicrobiales bacterium]|nr:WXG100 family type VII secretion target [Acidimicrobiales bacterium]
MAKGIAVTPQQLREISTQMSVSAADVEAIVRRLSHNVGPVRTEWVGSAQVYFNALWDELQDDASGLHSALTGIAKLTQNAAVAYEAIESSIAQSFDDFRSATESVHTVADKTDGVALAGGVDLDGTESVQCSEAVIADTEVSADEWEEISQHLNEAEEALSETALESNAEETSTEAEVEDDVTDEAGPSVVRPKGRLPWSRFTKATQNSGIGETRISTRVLERRFKTSDPALKPGSRLCRLCFTVVVIEPEYIETTATHVYVCCPHCGRSFPIRHNDI